jgi:hypothetical protein
MNLLGNPQQKKDFLSFEATNHKGSWLFYCPIVGETPPYFNKPQAEQLQQLTVIHIF